MRKSRTACGLVLIWTLRRRTRASRFTNSSRPRLGERARDCEGFLRTFPALRASAWQRPLPVGDGSCDVALPFGEIARGALRIVGPSARGGAPRGGSSAPHRASPAGSRAQPSESRYAPLRGSRATAFSSEDVGLLEVLASIRPHVAEVVLARRRRWAASPGASEALSPRPRSSRRSRLDPRRKSSRSFSESARRRPARRAAAAA